MESVSTIFGNETSSRDHLFFAAPKRRLVLRSSPRHFVKRSLTEPSSIRYWLRYQKQSRPSTPRWKTWRLRVVIASHLDL